MPQLNSIFLKPVDRPIEGVIKADDESTLRLELEEYVLTNETSDRLEDFLTAYNNPATANGVWISGFFGSGKSHLLKMLAVILENRNVDGVKALDLFLPKCGDNPVLKAELTKAVSIPSRSILFNIDQKADVISKTQMDALLSVFVKVFDEMCGYYGKLGHIASFERDLDKRNLYTAFKTTYQRISGLDWHQGREDFMLESSNITKAYSEVTKIDVFQEQILTQYRNNYRVSIEDFAAQVNDYIERQVPKFRLNFYVDEVGQYIADNVKLMTNLQTIAESLSTKSKGRAWILVTAQEDMNTVVGEMSKQQGNDFSKIQARFANRLKLTSADVAEVIQKRLLEKNPEGCIHLSEVFTAQQNNLPTLFTFADGSQTFKGFKDRDHFIQAYPFIPYQFPLFQSAIQNLSVHNAFEGRHSSVGERSMLGVFQQVVLRIHKDDLGQLATFDLMFEGIRTSLKSNIQRAILNAEQQLSDKLAVRLLKALFLVKYIREFKATLHNLGVLLLDSITPDVVKLRKQIDSSLSLLEQQSYIQRNGEIYEFLTNEEKDVEQEIKNTDVDSSEVAADLQKMIFDGVLKSTKIRSERNGQDYPFARKMDDKMYGREHELAIHIISPFNTFEETALRSHSMGKPELVVRLSSDDRFVRDLMLYKQTEKYVRQNQGSRQQETVTRILSERAHQNERRQADLALTLSSLLCKAKLFINADEKLKDSANSDAATRLIQGFQALVEFSYPNLRMLGTAQYKEDQIPALLKPNPSLITELPESEQEVLSFISANSREGTRSTIQSILEKFSRRPYGWPHLAIIAQIAKLCARSKIDVRQNGNSLNEAELASLILRTNSYSSLVLDPQIEFTPSQVRGLKDFYASFFHVPATAAEAKPLALECQAAFRSLSTECRQLCQQEAQYPFLSKLKALMSSFDKLLEVSPVPYLLTDFVKEQDTWLDHDETLLSPILGFMKGPQRGIYDACRSFLQEQGSNFDEIEGTEAAQLAAILLRPDAYKGPQVQEAKKLMESLKTHLSDKLKQERQLALEKLAKLESSLTDLPQFPGLDEAHKARISSKFASLRSGIESQNLAAVFRDSLSRFEQNDYGSFYSLVTTPAPKPNKTSGPENPLPAAPTLIRSSQLKVRYSKAVITDEADLDSYLASLRSAMLEALRNQQNIQL